MSPATQSLPSYLRKFAAEQKYDKYTAQDHAAWRFIMRQNQAFFSTHAVSVYAEGLKKTGISVDRIPRVSEMDDCLAKFGWGAVAVEGFIPPAAFLDFQARGVLPIACDMRTIKNLGYTSAPDIVHEAAGHAPILAYAPYAKYLNQYAAMAQKAIASDDDVRLYEAIRYLSDIKENPDATTEQIDLAEKRLLAVTAALGRPSESARVARMNWWTVEYGLVGDLSNPRIYGAGLLSSVDESQNCLSDKVRKIPLSLDCVETSYDITEPQPQLFVARDMNQLVEVLEAFDATLAYRVGGTSGLSEARLAKTVTTTQLDSGLEISGVLSDYQELNDEACFVKYTGAVQLSYLSMQMPGHGRERHGSGFSSPLRRWKGAPAKPLHSLTDADLKKMGLERGKRGHLAFDSGFEVSGILAGWTRTDGKLQLLTWKDCRVTRGSETFFEPAWGEFDMAVGEKVTSVWGGPSDRASYGEFNVGKASSSPGRTSPFSSDELRLFDAYAQLRRARESKNSAELASLAAAILKDWPNEWLLSMELLELSYDDKPAWQPAVEANLANLEKQGDSHVRDLIRKGRTLLAAHS